MTTDSDKLEQQMRAILLPWLNTFDHEDKEQELKAAYERDVSDLMQLIEAAQRSARQQVIDRTKLLASFQRDYCALHEKHAPRCANCIRARAMLANSEDLVYQLESWDYGAQLTDTTGANHE